MKNKVLVPVNKGLKEELIHYGEFVPRECYIDKNSGTIWRKNSNGTFSDITKDSGRVKNAIEHYEITVEKTRNRCRQGRKEWFRETDSK